MNVVMISPGFPPEMPFFTRGLKDVGATVIGMGDQPEGNLPAMARDSLAAYVRISSFSDEEAMIAEARRLAGEVRIDRVECLWEPVMITAARMREALGLPGMTVAETIPFRDKEKMKQVLDRAGIRTPRHHSVKSVGACREAAHTIGFPVVVKPIAGAGSADTYRVNSGEELEEVLPRLRHVPEVSVEEFVEGEDHTFDTVCAGGRVLFYNIAFYRPRALISRNNEWISPQTVAVRDPDSPHLVEGKRMGLAVLKALGFQTGFTHMEWYRKPDGEAVFGEIAARSAGARTVDVMNWASDLDLFRGWAEASCHGTFSQPVVRKYNAAGIFKRAQGQGTIRRYAGLERLMAEIGEHIACVELAPIGTPKANFLQSIIGDGFVMVRHPDLAMTLELGDRVATELQLIAT